MAANQIPSYSRDLDNKFLNTWSRIQAEVADNVINGTPVWAAFNEMGVLTTQVGDDRIIRQIRHSHPDIRWVKKGSTLGVGEKDTKTASTSFFKNLSVHVQRSIFDDRENQGVSKVNDYIADRFKEARDALVQEFESSLFRAFDFDETNDEMHSLNDLVPQATAQSSSTGIATAGEVLTANHTFGSIARANSSAAQVNDWWHPRYNSFTAPVEVNMLTDMAKLYNILSDNIEPPNLIIMERDLFETYEEFANDRAQIIKDADTNLANLGFDVLRYKGKPVIWTSNSGMVTGDMFMLNTNHIEVVYDPTMWFSMDDFKPTALQGERVAHIFSSLQLVTTDNRRQGRLYTA